MLATLRPSAVVAALTLLLAPPPSTAQRPDAEWRTIELPHYRLHYPAPAEPWARHVAARMESLREIVGELVGWTPEETVDVILQDPVGLANGSAWPLPGRPRMVLWATPPAAGSQLAFFQDWGELLVGHEQAHLTHLLRPARNRWDRWLSTLVPAAPIARKAPRWVTEGYATLLEGTISGRGRPHAHLRAAVLREWARAGRLPSYGRLAADREGWLGMSMAYLIGSAYLQWLQDGVGPEALPNLWRRMTARESRSFDEAFRGVFGDSPAAHYARFTADLSHRALELEESLAGLRHEGEVWQKHAWGTGVPAVSLDGERIVFVRTHREDPPRLVVLSTGPNEEAEETRRERIEVMLAADPEDVAPVDTDPLPRPPIATLTLEDSGAGASPRWLPDGSILFTQTLPDPTGVRRWDLFRWWPETGRTERLTRGADLRLADPAPDGGWATVLRVRWGISEILRMDLATGDLETLVPGEVGTLLDSPRIAPDGERLAYLRHREGDWELRVRNLSNGEDMRIPTPEATTLAHPAWRGDGRHLYLTVGQEGLLDLQAFPAGTGAEHHRVTRSLAAAYGPDPTPDGKFLYYLSLGADGVDVRRLSLDAATLQDVPLALDPALVPVIPPAPGEPIPIAIGEVPSSRPYGLGRAELDWFPGVTLAPSGRAGELGLRAGDVLGRWNALAAAALAERGGVEGFTLAGAWRGWPAEVGIQIYRSEERYGDQPEDVAPPADVPLDLDEDGLVLEARWNRFHPAGRLGLGIATGWSEVDPGGATDSVDRSSVRLDAEWLGEWRREAWTLGIASGAEGLTGTTDDADWEHFGGRLELALAHRGTALTLGARQMVLDGDPTALDQLRLGGTPSTVRPPLADAHRLLDPALPAGTAAGDRAQALTARLDTDALPLSPFWRRYRLWNDGAAKEDWLDLAGLELSLETAPFPLLGLAAAELRLGAAYILDRPLEDEVTGWLNLVWRP